MPARVRPARPAVHAEETLVRAIVAGRFAPGAALPAERELAARLGVTRPTLREALQRLQRDGWLEIRHGRETRVRDYWRSGGLGVLGALVRHAGPLAPGLVHDLLEVRSALAPAYAAAAVARQPPAVLALLAGAPELPEQAAAFARFDWALHRGLAAASGNAIYGLVLNGFDAFYEEAARLYFARAECRAASRRFYRALASAARRGAEAAAGRATRRAMDESRALWARLERRSARP
jgi:GntR family negative regulator for fad regulon and positive regulator of fabA